MGKLTDEVRAYLSDRQKKAAKTLRKKYGRDYFSKLADKRHNKAVK